MKFFRPAAIGFALLLVALVILANLGVAGEWFGFLYNFPNGDKIAHFLLMGTLSLLLSLGFPTARVRIFSLPLLKSSLIFAGVVALEELSQSLFPNRSASLLDLAASIAGILVMGELGALLKHRSVVVG